MSRSNPVAAVASGRITCKAAIAGTPLALLKKGFTRRLVRSRARTAPMAFCTWRVPPRTAGKRLVGSIALTFRGKTARRAFALRVR
ncbi:MAG: hypothetical protein H0T09_03535 [Actinobacteria bacterium]|nr:hypothetical protein [Actinomycetota bacterium]